MKFTIGIVTSLVLGGIALGIVLLVMNERAPRSGADANPSLIFAEQSLVFGLESQTPLEIKIQLSSARLRANLTLGAMTRVTPTVREFTNDPAGQERKAAAAEFMTSIAPATPPDLLRSLLPEFFFGFHAVDENVPILVLQLGSYERAFSSMLEWEKTINEDLSPLFARVLHNVRNAQGIPTLAGFEDVVIRNYDVRVLKGSRGEIRMLYAFPSRDILIIAESPHSFVETLARLRAERRL
mgnify:FL=1